jgi:hypothetical protein
LQVDKTVILDLASSELEFFRSLKELVLRSAELIKSENMEELMPVLEGKQTMISKHKDILGEWNGIGLSLGLKVGCDDTDFRMQLFQALSNELFEESSFFVKLKSIFEQIKTLAEESICIEDDSQEVLNEYVKRLRARISQVSKGRDACRGYASASGSSLYSR